MSENKKYTGAELRARRERLGLSVEDVARHPEFVGYRSGGPISALMGDVMAMEGLSADSLASGWVCGARRYTAALDAEEMRRANAEPVPPAGVTLMDNGTNVVVRRRDKTSIAHVGRDGGTMILHDGCADPDALEYVAALSRYRASVHADRQHKLDALKTAAEARQAAEAELDAVREENRKREDKAAAKHRAAIGAHIKARREAGPARRCEVCGREAMETGSEPRCREHDSEKSA